MSEINRIRELGIRLSDLPDYVITGCTDTSSNTTGTAKRIDTCPGDVRQMECGRKFVIDCYEVTFLSRLPEEQRNQIVGCTARSDYVTAGRNRDGIRDYDAVREERRRCHDLRIYRRRGQHWLSSGCVVHGLMQQILSFSDHGVRQSDGLVCFFAVMLEFQQCAPKKNDMQKSTDSLPGRFRFTLCYIVDSKDARKDVPESQILGCMRSCSVRRIQS